MSLGLCPGGLLPVPTFRGRRGRRDPLGDGALRPLRDQGSDEHDGTGSVVAAGSGLWLLRDYKSHNAVFQGRL